MKKNAFVLLNLPHFDGFPYLVTGIVPAMYHIILLPAGLPRKKYLDLLARQRQANQLTTSLALSDSTAWYGGGRSSPANSRPARSSSPRPSCSRGALASIAS